MKGPRPLWSLKIEMATNRPRSIRLHLVVLALYTLLAVITSWPLVRYLHSHVPGSETWALDEYTFLWNAWWFRYSLFNLGQSPLHTNYTFYPLGVSLVLYTYNLFNALVSLPLQPFFSLPAISNLTFLSTTVLSGYGTFLLVESLVRKVQRPAEPSRSSGEGPRESDRLLPLVRYGAAFLSGLIYAFGSYRMVYAAIGHYDMWSTAWIPFYLFFLMRTIQTPGWRNAALAGVCFALALLCEMIFGVFLGLFTLILLAFALSGRPETLTRLERDKLLKRIAVMILVATVLYMPVLIPILQEMSKGYELAGWGDAEKLSVDLLGLVTPTALHPLGGDWVQTLAQTREGTSRFRVLTTGFLGWAGLALAVVGAARYRRYLAAWTTSFAVFTILSLGPLLQVNGRSTFDLDGLQVNVPLPFILFHYIPVVKANRVPNRFSVVLMLALAVLAGFGAYWLLQRVTRGKPQTTRRFLYPGCGLLAALLLFEHWSVPLPLTDTRLPSVYESAMAEGDDCTILQLPLGWRHSFGMYGAEDTRTQYYQTYHHKRLLSGNISRTPPFQFDYFRRVPILDSLITLQTYGEVDADRRAADRATAGEFVTFYNICYIAVAPGIPGRPPYEDTRDAALSYVKEVLPVERVARQDNWILYRVKQPPLPRSFAVDLGASAPRRAMVLGEGWTEAEEIQGVMASWAIAQKARVFLPAVVGNDYRLTVTALPFVYPGAPEQRVTLWVNGQRLDPLSLAPTWQTYHWQVPARFLQPGLNELSFEFARLDRPADVLPGDGAIGQTGVQAPTAIEVNSGGPSDFAYITIGTGAEAKDGSVHRRGYNVAVIHPKTGRLLERQGFDLTPSGSEAEGQALADFIRQVPRGQIVVVALQGDQVHLTERVIAAFREIGGQADLRGTVGWSHAIIGVKGAAPGAALEVEGPGDGWLRVAPDQRTLAMAVDAVVWEPVGQPE